MGEQSMRQSAWGHYYNYHTTDRRGQSVGGSRVPFARDTWEGSLSISLSVSPVYLNLSLFFLSGARTHTHTHKLVRTSTIICISLSLMKLTNEREEQWSRMNELMPFCRVWFHHGLPALWVQPEKCEGWKIRGACFLFPAPTRLQSCGCRTTSSDWRNRLTQRKELVSGRLPTWFPIVYLSIQCPSVMRRAFHLGTEMPSALRVL